MAESKIRRMRRSEYETPEETRKRVERNKKARARHWTRTGVSEATVRWMEREAML